LFAANCLAQSVVIPSALATAPPPSKGNVLYVNGTTFRVPEAHSQLIYDVTDIAPTVALWNSLQVRALPNLGVTTPFNSNATIQLALCPTAPSAMTTSFANNLLGSTSATVYSGPISLPTRTTSAWPAAWEAPIVFAAPFVYIQATGKSLLIDIVHTGGTGPSYWGLEVWAPDMGSSTLLSTPQASCKLGNGSIANFYQVSPTPYLGSSWTLSYVFTPTATPVTVPGVAVFGSQGVGGMWAGLNLPIDMTAFNAPGCFWATSAELQLPLTPQTGIAMQRTGTIPIPNVPSLGGQAFYDQGIFLDASANGLGIVTSTSCRWVIGSLQGGPGAFVGVGGAGSSTATTGAYTNGYVTTVKLN
jgi:hypothetical protein